MQILRILILILFVGIFNKIYSQFIYTKQGNIHNNILSVMSEPVTNNLLLTCTNFSLNVGNDYVNAYTSILKINENGQMLDSFAIGQNFNTAGKMLYDNNFYYIYGFESSSTSLNNRNIYPTVFKFDSNFNQIKKLKLDSVYVNTVSSIQNTVIINNQLYLAYYYGQTPKAKLFKLSLNLDIVDSLTIQAFTLMSMIKQDNHLLIAGGGFPNGSLLGRAQVAKLDTNFTIISRFNLDSITTFTLPNCTSKLGIWPYNCNLVEISNRSYFVSGYASTFDAACHSLEDDVLYGIVKDNNQITRGAQYGTPGNVRESEQNFSTMAERQGKNIYKTCISDITNGIISHTNYTPTSILTAKIDTSGNLLWKKYFSTPNYYYQPMALCTTADSSIIITGMRYNTLTPQFIDEFEGFVLKYDKNGNEVFVNVYEMYKPYSEMLLYPNPAINETSLSINSENAESTNIVIIDILGKKVYSSNEVLEKGLNTISIDTKQFTNGIYNFTVSSKSGSITKKLAITK